MAREPPPPVAALAQLWRPTPYGDEIARRIADAVGEGMPLVLVHELDGMPAKATIEMWRSNNKRFRIRCDRARVFYASVLADDALTIADGTAADPARAVVPEHIGRARLRFETRRWLAGRLAPATFNTRATDGAAQPPNGKLETKPDDQLEEDRQRIAAAQTGAQ